MYRKMIYLLFIFIYLIERHYYSFDFGTPTKKMHILETAYTQTRF